jgi:predicted DNA repair protein MutK
LLTSLSSIGTAAMLWVGGGIILHGIEDLGFETFPHTVHESADWLAAQIVILEDVTSWLARALAAAIVGLVIGGILVIIVRQLTKHPERYVVDA